MAEKRGRRGDQSWETAKQATFGDGYGAVKLSPLWKGQSHSKGGKKKKQRKSLNKTRKRWRERALLGGCHTSS